MNISAPWIFKFQDCGALKQLIERSRVTSLDPILNIINIDIHLKNTYSI